jgi:hypothetical protein
MEQKVIFFKKDGIDLIGGQVKAQIEKHCIEGWFVHQIQPTHFQEYGGGILRLEAAIIILQKKP